MKYLTIVFVLLLTACVPVTTPVLLHLDVIIIADSLQCNTANSGGETAGVQSSIVVDCVPGRRLVDYGDMPTGYRVAFVALITNDVLQQTPVNEYRAKLQSMLLTDAVVHCVLATQLPNVDSEVYNTIMREECPSVINPIDYGVLPRAADLIHWTFPDHDLFVPALTSRI